jgi:hypothetical protein
VRVICPQLIPDVQLETMKGSFGAVPEISGGHSGIYMMSFDKALYRSTSPPRVVKHWIVGGG